MTESDSRVIVYEQPLSERIRSFLRLEHLFQRVDHEIVRTHPWSNRTALESVINIITVIGRTDLKKELINELDRYAATFESLSRNPRVDPTRLNEVLDHVKRLLSHLRSSSTPFGQEVLSNELLSAVRQRSSIPAGTCSFDLPAYHHWLTAPREQQTADMNRWFHSFDLLHESVDLCLALVRDSAVASREIAAAGFFQRSLEGAAPFQLLRVCVVPELECYPEISAGKHRFAVRFMRPNGPARPIQHDSDVSFDLHCCAI